MSRHPAPAPLRRFVVALVIGVGLAFGGASAVPAASFDDGFPCPKFVCPNGTVDTPYSLQLTGLAGCDIYWWEIPNGSLPPGLTMTRSGLISGTPTVAGTAKFWVHIHDVLAQDGGHAWCAGDNTSEREFTLRIDPGLVVTTQSAPGAVTGAQYSLPLAVGLKSGPETIVPAPSAPSWSISGGQLPPGLTLDAGTGLISGVPTTNGAYAFTARAALVDGRTASKAFSIEVRTLLSLVPPQSIPASEVGVPVSLQLGASGGAPPYTWTLSAGALPSGVALTAAGAIAGRPTAAGTFRFTATVADSGGQSQSYAGSLVVAPRLAIATSQLDLGQVGKAYRATLVATGGVAPTLWTVTRGPLPRGVKLDRRLGVLSGTPTKAGRYKLRLQAQDTLGVRATNSYLMVVAAAPKKPKR